MKLLLRDSFFHLPYPIPQSQSRNTKCLPWMRPLPPPLQFLNRRNSYHFNLSSKVVFGVRFDGPIMEIGKDSGMEDGDFVVETCITRTLPPALTLEKGLESIKDAVQKLKLNPPSTSSGFFRFQVAVPPSAKALDWFCCQPESSEVFPVFFMSKETKNPDCKSLYVNETRGVFGIGSAVHFTRSSSSISGEKTTTKRYLSNDSTLVMAYGFTDVNFDKELSFMKHEEDCYYFFIPQLELNEYEGTSILAVTLAWCDSSICTFAEAIESYELSLHQATCHICPTEKRCSKSIISTFRKLNVLEDRTLLMVYTNTLSAGGNYVVKDFMELKEMSSSRQFCIRLSPTVVVSSNMLDNDSDKCYSVQDCANINAVWASIIIEECFRNGLTYFCVAPGSRSSPLAVAASTHPLITCIACFDERSLAFHAVGYARGSCRPAVVITSSGTAVSNLLPAVVEANQDFVPLLLLTADRPAELQDAGANQSINQINHFGSFVRFFFSLPAPTDHIPARMVLTTVDSAVHWATSSPCGPVHINCPFREPLENSPSKWMLSCLKGLDFWMSSAEPFTKYIQIKHAHASNNTPAEFSEVLNVIQKVNKGLLLIGAIHTEDEIWAVLLLAKRLLWPVVADILSGLRLRKFLISFPEIKNNIVFVDHLDHALLSDFVRGWIRVDVILQIGSRITSKRVLKLLEECTPLSYIMVDKHPFRYDPSHIVTHRIHSNIVEFADYLLKLKFPNKSNEWSTCLHTLNMTVARELSFQIHAESSLTEPLVSRTISEALSTESALFIGNSMAIRDADMYGCGWSNCSRGIATTPLDLELPSHFILVAGNRGASGIDGLLSTAVGFAVGCNKRVLCVVGDISFLHDTNGLAILNQRTLRKPMTILVINNHGGAIFSLLPIADRVEPKILSKYFYTSHNVSISGLCMAHGVKHLEVQTKAELQDALFTSQREEMDSVIEVGGHIDNNAIFHSTLRKFALLAANDALSVLQRLSVKDSVSDDLFLCKVHRMEYSLFRIQLCSPPTKITANYEHNNFYREGFILSLYLDDGSVGYGEVAPLDFCKENLQGVEEQLRLILHVMKGAKISCFIPLLKGSFSSWIWTSLGILPSSLFPSVRCGLEMAILNAIAARQDSNLLSIFHSWKDERHKPKGLSKVKICALVDSKGTPTEVAASVASLVEEGFVAIKLKVARQRSPMHDAEVIQEVRKKVGQHIELRVDANRNWTFQEAIQFGSLVRDCNLQYIEEPVKDETDIIRFCEESGLPVALDETIDSIQENPLDMLAKYKHPGIVAIVIKPSVVGGFENAAMIAQWAQQHGKMAVVSATFESGLGLSAYIHFSCYLEQKNVEVCKIMNNKSVPSIAHGLGTYQWLKEDVATTPLKISQNAFTGFVEASVVDADQLLKSFQVNHHVVQRNFTGESVCRYQLPVESNGFTCLFKVQEIGQTSKENVLVFLHGFLGTGEDWISIMEAISGCSRCISIDLPGHGGTKIQNHSNNTMKESCMSVEVVADVICNLIHQITPGKVTIVGYSMGARIALYMALKFTDKVKGAVVISGSPGLKNEVARKVRKAKDDSRASFLVAYGLHLFVENWYAGPLWSSLRGHPKFKQIVASRLHHEDVQSLAKLLSDSSVGRQLPLWEDLKHTETPLLFIVGEKDSKFKAIAHEMCYTIDSSRKTSDASSSDVYELFEIPDSGHAPHLENPLPVVSALRRFNFKLEDGNTTNLSSQ
ncbi:protein PHYLLO, chloroplastic isoform X2 [Ziziphus jujuba]|uniref:Protein PHYLLO, chloroplastic isoform X2 n=1 Tax=Ziziphus jujuba TaxID=326968 RepID=A0A6P6GJM7_ZIZJJ|nr:protein PHYLLO, chloroplastic isoform X2 [Ziziphus jujuba]